MQKQNLKSIIDFYGTFPCRLSTEQAAFCRNKTGFVLYADHLNLSTLQRFGEKCGENFQILAAWQIAGYNAVLLEGKWEPLWIETAYALRCDIARLDFDVGLEGGGLLVMDMDSTVIQVECIDEIAKLAGVGEKVAAITDQAMRGELDFEQSLRCRIATLKDQPESILHQVLKNLPLMPGLEEMLICLQKRGWKTVIASGGFSYFANFLKEKLGLDAAFANEFDIEQGRLTGNVKGKVVDAKVKADTLKRQADRFGVPLTHTVAIGDGANDLMMMAQANLGIAFHAKPKVRQQAQVVVNFADLRALICILAAKDKFSQYCRH